MAAVSSATRASRYLNARHFVWKWHSQPGTPIPQNVRAELVQELAHDWRISYLRKAIFWVAGGAPCIFFIFKSGSDAIGLSGPWWIMISCLIWISLVTWDILRERRSRRNWPDYFSGMDDEKLLFSFDLLVEKKQRDFVINVVGTGVLVILAVDFLHFFFRLAR